MGDVVLLVVLGGAVLVAAVVKGFSALQRKLAPVVEVWEGDIVAAVIRFEQDPRRPGAVTPQSADVVIRRRGDGSEHESFVGGVDSLPESVRRQVSAAVSLTTGTESELTESSAPDPGPLPFAAHGGYRIHLAKPVAVQVEENDRGSLQWKPLW